MSLLTLEQHNNKRRERLEPSHTRPNGIACPECNLELVDTDNRYTLTSSPPQKNIHCPACGWAGYRLA
jgi:DNA-directed RNA polymerase subunit RPC12/RpoP